jgi:thiamine biosynthesis lipoprotein
MPSKFRRSNYLACLVVLHALVACGDQRLTEYRLSGPIMGTQYTVAIATDASFEKDELQRQVHAVLSDVDARMSTYVASSEVTRFNQSRSTGWTPVSRDVCNAVAHSLALSTLTDGAYDITVAALVDLWGFGPGNARTVPPENADINLAMLVTGFGNLHADCERPAIRKDIEGLTIDLSAYAKGHAVDRVAVLLDQSGISNYLVDIGGDLRARGHNADKQEWRIAIEMPDAAGHTTGKIIRLSEGSVATSGDYRNFFEAGGQRYSHTIDPTTGRPVAHRLASVTVISETAAIADAMATALLALGPEAGLAFAERENIAAYFLVREGNEIAERASTGFQMQTNR